MTYSVKLSDIKALGKWEIHYTKKPFAFSQILSQKKVIVDDLQIQT